MLTISQSNGQRFIVIGTARTGSNLLQTLLNSHGAIRMYGELYNLDNLSKENLAEALVDPVTYLRKRLCPDRAGENRAIGFKMFYDHLTDEYFKKMIVSDVADENLKKKFSDLDDYITSHHTTHDLNEKFRAAWNYLANDKDLKVIHLTRPNKLKTLVSLKTAYLTNQWMRLKQEEPSTIGFHLEYEECYNYFTRIDLHEKTCDAIFQDHDQLNITYDDLVKDKQQVANQVFDFLGLAHTPVNTILKKQITYPLEDAIHNFHELKKAFRDSPWYQFFES